jgi:hypothetical protein
MKKSLCVWLMVIIPSLIMGNEVDNCNNWTPEEIDNAWIRVPWTQGGYYYHNTLTRDDQDNEPKCLSGNCNRNWD